MESGLQSNSIELTRQEALRVWLSRSGLTHSKIGKSLDMTGPGVTRLLSRDTAPVHRVAQLVGLGIPSDLLPRPVNLKPGPKPRAASLAEGD